ncbi:hypothetical protein HGM15179_009825 [Zosterops borbonicus]|uniref:Uncharacterized protein n=1 Tax=Zosterops borbonicus TaxID=364589 RepID=A0A8K1GFS0_9PASS|nr:hypothetical protein HGM15179_009825 [Zosterops borbonicus]
MLKKMPLTGVEISSLKVNESRYRNQERMGSVLGQRKRYIEKILDFFRYLQASTGRLPTSSDMGFQIGLRESPVNKQKDFRGHNTVQESKSNSADESIRGRYPWLVDQPQPPDEEAQIAVKAQLKIAKGCTRARIPTICQGIMTNMTLQTPAKQREEKRREEKRREEKRREEKRREEKRRDSTSAMLQLLCCFQVLHQRLSEVSV